jgi:hypothetical protein
MSESTAASSTSTPPSPTASSATPWRPVVPAKLAVMCLVTTVVLTAVSVGMMPDLPETNAALLESLADAPAQSAIAAASYTLSQLFFIGAILAIGDIARAGAPRLIGAGMVLGIIGAFGHSVFGGLRLALFGMLTEAGRTEYAAALDRTYDSPVMLFAALGLIGTVVGLLLLALGLLKSRTVAPWIPTCLIGFLILEFVGGNLSSWASSGAVALYAAALLGLAAIIIRGREPRRVG